MIYGNSSMLYKATEQFYVQTKIIVTNEEVADPNLVISIEPDTLFTIAAINLWIMFADTRLKGSAILVQNGVLYYAWDNDLKKHFKKI